jgi:processive 1,2-diacylglycerol beta-glucosyltransferase
VLVIVNPVPGQEERNSDHFLEEGVAIRCNNIPALAYKIDTLLADKERLSKMQQAVERLARPHAAADIISIAMGR